MLDTSHVELYNPHGNTETSPTVEDKRSLNFLDIIRTYLFSTYSPMDISLSVVVVEGVGVRVCFWGCEEEEEEEQLSDRLGLWSRGRSNGKN